MTPTATTMTRAVMPIVRPMPASRFAIAGDPASVPGTGGGTAGELDIDSRPPQCGQNASVPAIARLQCGHW